MVHSRFGSRPATTWFACMASCATPRCTLVLAGGMWQVLNPCQPPASWKVTSMQSACFPPPTFFAMLLHRHTRHGQDHACQGAGA